MKNKTLVVILLAALLIAMAGITRVKAQGPQPGPHAPSAQAGTAFSYQGQLKNGGAPVNGTCDIIFALYDASTGGNQIGYAVGSPNPTTVTNGLFTVQVDFGANVIKGDAAWLYPAVRCPAGSGSFVPLDPRQPLTPAPMALALPGLYTQQNATSPNLIGGLSSNVISPTVVGGTISGGGRSDWPNRVTDDYGVIGGGMGNQAGDNAGTTSDADHATVGGGFANTASGSSATVGGGAVNNATNSESTVSGGFSNDATGYRSVVGGGQANTASGYGATIPGGRENKANGSFSFAAGLRANANAPGTFVWADATRFDIDFTANVTNSFLVRASGGIYFGSTTASTPSGKFIDTWTHGYLSDSGVWTDNSNKNLKANFTAIDAKDILARVSTLPLSTWNYTTDDPAIRHIGPMAQDFYAAFNVGEDDTHLAALDTNGVALAAIQGLAQENQELKSQISNLESRLAALEQNAPANNPVNSNSLALIVIGVLFGIVVVQKPWRRGER